MVWAKVSLSRKRLWKWLSIQYAAKNFTTSKNSPVIVYWQIPKNSKCFFESEGKEMELWK